MTTKEKIWHYTLFIVLWCAFFTSLIFNFTMIKDTERIHKEYNKLVGNRQVIKIEPNKPVLLYMENK